MIAKYKQLWLLIEKAKLSKKYIFFAFLLVLTSRGAALAYPLITQQLIDRFDTNQFPWLLLSLLAGLLLTMSITSGINVLIMGSLGENFVKATRIRIFSNLLRLPVSYYETRRSAEPASQLMSDAKQISDFISFRVINLVSGVITLIGTIVILYRLDIFLTLILFICVVAAFAIVFPVSNFILHISKNTQQKEAKIVGYLAEMFHQLRHVKMFTAELYEQKNAEKYFSSLHYQRIKEIRLIALLYPISTSLLSIAMVIILTFGAVRMNAGELSLGALIAYTLYLFNIISPVEQLSLFAAALNKAVGASERLIELENEKIENTQGIALPNEQYQLAIKALNFRYTDQSETALSIDQLCFPDKGIVSIVGLSGSGKSTLFSLINRLYDCDGITLNGKDINLLNLEQWRQSLANVAQNSPILLGTVRSNLMYGMPDLHVDDDRLIQVLKTAQLWQVIDGKGGLDALVGENGTNFSGGQKQRLAIARALLRQPKLFLLDEATSALDAQTENAINTAITELADTTLILMSTHRMDIVEKSALVCLLHRGNLRGVGSHSELINSNALYQDLMRAML